MPISGETIQPGPQLPVGRRPGVAQKLSVHTPPPMLPRQALHSVPYRARRRTGGAHRPASEATPGSQLALFARYSYHAFITDRDGEALELEADHRRQAEVENAISDLRYGVRLNHMPSGRFA